jgi:alkaline phosphatase D
VNYGFIKALPENDYTVKVDVCGLNPNSWYYFMFQHDGRNSITGRTRTAPLESSDNDSARFAIVSCSDFKNGFFNAYQSIADRNDVDAVLHLGDYIYEYANSGGNSNRTIEPANEIITQSDYRLRHSNQKLDNQLKRCHQLNPFICVWDDHETANNSWKDGAENHQANEGPWSVRKWNGVNAYYEWMPIRRPDLADSFRIYRNFRWGKLANLIMLDSRLYARDEQNGSKRNDTAHHILGPTQQNWLLQQMSDTISQWKIIGNQVMFAA